jgi:hypothetical protein
VLGGTSLFGGSGTICGSVIGAFLLATIQIGLVLIGVPGSFYVTFIGVILVIVVITNVRLAASAGSSDECRDARYRVNQAPANLPCCAPGPGSTKPGPGE